MKLRLFTFGLLWIAASWSLGAQTLDNAREIYEKESFEKAFAAVTEGVPSNASGSLKTQAAEVLYQIANAEYTITNHKNAYDALRQALKYSPTHAQSSSLFLKMRRELNVSALRNSAPPRQKAPEPVPVAPVASPGASPLPPETSPETASPGTPEVTGSSQPQGAPSVPLTELQTALAEASARLQAMESSVGNTKEENRLLRSQVEQQLTLLKNFTANPAPVRVQSDPAERQREQELFARTMELISKISEKEAAAPQLVVQTDPTIAALVERSGNMDTLILTVLIILGALILGIIFLFVWMGLRSRKRMAQGGDRTYNPLPPRSGVTYNPTAPDQGKTPLLEFVDASSGPRTGGTELSLQRDLLKADRLNRMYEEVRSGGLSWNTVRQYIGELDIALRTEILKCVERKIDEGDLLAPEAILPIIFPFLTDYDDFVREKAEKLSERALMESRSKASPSSSGLLEGPEDMDPLSIKNLMEIPRKLQAIFKNQDQTLLTAKICRGMGTVLGMPTEDRNWLYKAALAHDCGYLLLDKEQLSRTVAKAEINEEDFAFIQSHATQGLNYFGEMELPDHFKAGILAHHERNDGSGYPLGLKKDDIHEFAKIIGIAETFSALISKRSYRDKRDVAHALAIISDGARTKFDRAHVEALIKVANSLGDL